MKFSISLYSGIRSPHEECDSVLRPGWSASSGRGWFAQGNQWNTHPGWTFTFHFIDISIINCKKMINWQHLSFSKCQQELAHHMDTVLSISSISFLSNFYFIANSAYSAEILFCSLIFLLHDSMLHLISSSLLTYFRLPIFPFSPFCC